jgi:hypothetical protein
MELGPWSGNHPLRFPPLKKGYVNKGVTFVLEDTTTQLLISTFKLLGQVSFGFWPIL